MAKDMDGVVIKPGEFISWKSGVETSGKVTAVNGECIWVEYNDPITDEPRNTTVNSRRCWHE